MNSAVCEACRISAAEREFLDANERRPYRLCHSCSRRLELRSLRPLEWFNLAALHGGGKFLLHDDFYDQDGTACQPEEEVVDAALFPAPTLDDVHGELPRLIDYCITRWSIDAPVVEALTSFPERDVLNELVRRADDSAERDIIDTCLYICSLAVGATGADWVRKERTRLIPNRLSMWAEAAASSLPLEEGFQSAVDALETCSLKDLAYAAHALAAFGTSRTLDWIESKLPASGLPVTESWGRLAAVSGLNWARVQKWLRHGRPLSLAVLDALNACWHYNTPYLRKVRPRLTEPPPRDEAARALQDYLPRDPVPRVKMTIPVILAHWEEIAGEDIQK